MPDAVEVSGVCQRPAADIYVIRLAASRAATPITRRMEIRATQTWWQLMARSEAVIDVLSPHPGSIRPVVELEMLTMRSPSSAPT